jgi:hypothetical protein
MRIYFHLALYKICAIQNYKVTLEKTLWIIIYGIKLGQRDPNTFSKIEVQIQNTFGVTTLRYHYWQVVGGRIYG